MSSHPRSRFNLPPGQGVTLLLGGILLALAVGLTLLAAGLASNLQASQAPPEAQALDQRMIRIADELHCPVCAGQSVAFSNSLLATEMRRTIAEQLEVGKNEAEIMNYFVERYGISILREPPRQGLNTWLWITPVVVVVWAASWLAWTLWRMARTRPPVEETTEDAPELDDEVRDLLARYDEELFAR